MCSPAVRAPVRPRPVSGAAVHVGCVEPHSDQPTLSVRPPRKLNETPDTSAARHEDRCSCVAAAVRPTGGAPPWSTSSVPRLPVGRQCARPPDRGGPSVQVRTDQLAVSRCRHEGGRRPRDNSPAATEWRCMARRGDRRRPRRWPRNRWPGQGSPSAVSGGPGQRPAVNSSSRATSWRSGRATMTEQPGVRAASRSTSLSRRPLGASARDPLSRTYRAKISRFSRNAASGEAVASEVRGE